MRGNKIFSKAMVGVTTRLEKLSYIINEALIIDFFQNYPQKNLNILFHNASSVLNIFLSLKAYFVQ